MTIKIVPKATWLSLIALVINFLSANSQCLIPGYDVGFGTISCFKVGNLGSVTWNQANKSCHGDGEGAHLVAITSEEENEFIMEQMDEANLVSSWIGLNNITGGGWTWAGVPLRVGPPDYYKWQDSAGSAEPDPDGADPNDSTATDVKCVSLQFLTGQWSDRSCSSSAGYGFVCQSPGPPTSQPSGAPSMQPASVPTINPSVQPTSLPSQQPFNSPTSSPSSQPVSQPSSQPNSEPSSQPSTQPFLIPTSSPSSRPSAVPSTTPSAQPASYPTSEPSVTPTSTPTQTPTSIPTRLSAVPTEIPSSRPSSTIQVTVSSSMYILNSDLTTFDGADAYTLALAATICIPFGVLPSSVTVSSTTPVIDQTRRRLMGVTLVASTVGVVELSEMPTAYKADPDALPEHLNSELTAYILSGEATTHFRSELRTNGVENEDDILIITSNSNLDDYTTQPSSSGDDTLVAALVSVFVILFVCCGAVFASYWYFYVYKKEQAEKETSDHDEDIEIAEEGKGYDGIIAMPTTESFSHTDIFKSAELDGEEPVVTSTKETAEFEDLRTKMKKAEGDSGTNTPRRLSRRSSKQSLVTSNGFPESEAAKDFLEIKKEFERLVLKNSQIRK